MAVVQLQSTPRSQKATPCKGRDGIRRRAFVGTVPFNVQRPTFNGEKRLISFFSRHSTALVQQQSNVLPETSRAPVAVSHWPTGTLLDVFIKAVTG